MIPNEVIKELLEKADIVQIISNYIPVIKKGNSYRAVCPFHNDTNPSLQISQTKQIYKCFVCQAGGNAISFVAEYEKISYVEAIRKVAELCNFTHPSLEQQQRFVPKQNLDLIKACNDATTFYAYVLNTPAGIKGKEYLDSRNISSDMISFFSLGFSPENGETTIKHLRSKNNDVASLDEAGILVRSQDKFIDRFNGRVIFPIHNIYGETIGFSARKIDNSDTAKFINSPATIIFNKSQVLYNIHNAKKECKKAGYCYIVEGFMDVFALYKCGIKSSVALMGTAFTKEHAKILKNLGVEIRLCLDGDDAGQHGILSMLPILEEFNVPYRIINYNGDKRDPDDIYQNEGEIGLKKILSKSISKEHFLINYFSKKYKLDSMEGKTQFVNSLIPYINLKNPIEYDVFIELIAKTCSLSVSTIKRTLDSQNIKVNIDEPIDVDFNQNIISKRKNLTRIKRAQRNLIYYVLENIEVYEFIKKSENIVFVDDIYNHLINYIEDLYLTNKNIAISDLINSIMITNGDKSLIDEITNITMCTDIPPYDEEVMVECLKAIKKDVEKKEKQQQFFNKDLDVNQRAQILDLQRKE